MGIATRKSDEVMLDMLRRYRQGQTSPQIGRAIGKSATNVTVMISKIRKADIAESGESPEVVDDFYRPVKFCDRRLERQ